MPVRWEPNRFLTEVEKKTQRGLETAAQFLVRRIKLSLRGGQPPGPPGGKPHRLTGTLARSIDYEMGELRARIGTGLVYGRIQELGGVVRPKSARALAIPIHRTAKKAEGPKSFNNLTMIQRSGRPPLLVRIRGKAMDVMYVLLKRVNIPKRPYLRPALDDLGNRKQIERLVARG